MHLITLSKEPAGVRAGVNKERQSGGGGATPQAPASPIPRHSPYDAPMDRRNARISQALSTTMCHDAVIGWYGEQQDRQTFVHCTKYSDEKVAYPIEVAVLDPLVEFILFGVELAQV